MIFTILGWASVALMFFISASVVYAVHQIGKEEEDQ